MVLLALSAEPGLPCALDTLVDPADLEVDRADLPDLAEPTVEPVSDLPPADLPADGGGELRRRFGSIERATDRACIASLII